MRKELVAAIIIEDGRILLVHNIKYRTRFEPPGGKIEQGESPEDAVRREVMEEIGCEVEVQSLFAEEASQSAEGEFLVKMYRCIITDGKPSIQAAEQGKINSVGWYNYSEIAAMAAQTALAPNLVQILPHLNEQLQ